MGENISGAPLADLQPLEGDGYGHGSQAGEMSGDSFLWSQLSTKVVINSPLTLSPRRRGERVLRMKVVI